MNIDGHEIERRDGPGPARVYIDGEASDYTGSRDPDFYARTAESLRVEIARSMKDVSHAELLAEFVRREAAEKAAQDAADELDRRAALAHEVWYGDDGTRWEHLADEYRDKWRGLVRALDADAAEREA